MNNNKKIETVLNEIWDSLGAVTREPFEDNYDGFTHCEKSGLIEEVEEILEDENLNPTASNIEDIIRELL